MAKYGEKVKLGEDNKWYLTKYKNKSIDDIQISSTFTSAVEVVIHNLKRENDHLTDEHGKEKSAKV